MTQTTSRSAQALHTLWFWAMARVAAWTEDAGQSEWVGQIMILGIVVIIAALAFAFWKAGGSTWVNSQLSSITQY